MCRRRNEKPPDLPNLEPKIISIFWIIFVAKLQDPNKLDDKITEYMSNLLRFVRIGVSVHPEWLMSRHA